MPKKKKKNLNKKNNLFIGREKVFSRFVIDLKEDALKNKDENEDVKNKISDKIEDVIADIDFKDYVTKITDFFNAKVDTIKKLQDPQKKLKKIIKEDNLVYFEKIESFKEESIKEGISKHKETINFKERIKRINKIINNYKIDQLAVFSFSKFTIHLFLMTLIAGYKLCYAFGWTFLFVVRFVYFFFKKITSSILPHTKKIFYPFSFLSAVFVANIGGATQLVYKKSKHTLAKTLNIEFKFNKKFSLFKTKNIAKKVSILSKKFSQQKDKAKIILTKEKINKESKVKEKNKISFKELLIQKKRKVYDHFFKDEVADNLPLPKLRLSHSLFSFALILFILIIPFKVINYYKTLNLADLKGRVLGVSESAAGNIISASGAVRDLNFSSAEDDFSQASENFLQAQEELEEINDVFFFLASLAPQEEIRLASESKNILNAGDAASQLGVDLSLAFESLFENEEKNIEEILNNFVIYGNDALEDAKNLNLELNKINIKVVPEEYREQFEFLTEKSASIEQGLDEFVSVMNSLQVFLGMNQNKRYLFVFQNNTEMRATGGFIGSFALIDFSKGNIKNLEIPGGGSYDTEGGLRELVAAPEPLSLVNPLWYFWDANWWPDWATSAEKLMWFYEKSDGSTVDGVVSFTPTVMERMLEIIGPVDMTEEYGVTINADNFWSITQAIVEEKPTAEQLAEDDNKPKKIIGDLMNKIINELPSKLDKNTLIGLFSVFQQSLEEKHILFYFTDDELQQEVEARNWAGRIKDTERDYLAVINTNIAGGKSDKTIEETINHVAEIMPDGSVINTIKIKREHTASTEDDFSGVRNVDWMRIYVPLGSELMEAQGFQAPDDIYFEEADPDWEQDPEVYRAETTALTDEESGTKIYEEQGKTVFANWSMVDPGESTVIYLRYKLPFKLIQEEDDDGFWSKVKNLLGFNEDESYPYSILIQKQAGAKASKINSSLKIADGFNIIWHYPSELDILEDGWQIGDELDSDKYWATLIN